MPGTGLANFREQYPQYAEVEDEELARAVKERYYPDLAEDDYRDQMGLAVVPKPPPEPTMWDRVTGIFESEDETPAGVMRNAPRMIDEFGVDYLPGASGFPIAGEERPEQAQEVGPLLRDQWWAGVDEYRANRATSKALGLIGEGGRVEDIARGRSDPSDFTGFGQVGKFARNVRAEQGDAVAAAAIQKEIDGRNEVLVTALQASIDKRAELMERAATVPYSQATKEMLEAKGADALGELSDDPMQIMAEISLRSLPNMADAIPLAIAGAIAGGPLGFASGMGMGSGMAEYRASFADGLQNEGVDLADARSLIAASKNTELMARVHAFAMTRSTIIGVASTISGGVAAKPLTPFIKNIVGREAANVAAQTVVQGGIEGLGEAGAQLATTGELHGGEVLAEAIGGAITAPIDVGAAVVSGARAQHFLNEVARIESEVNDMLALDVPRETETGQTDGALQQDQALSQKHELAQNRILELEAEFDALPTDQKANPRNFTNLQLESARETLAEVEAAAVPPVQGELDLGPIYVDERLRSRSVRDQLLQDAQALGTDVPARRAQTAVQRAVTGKPLSEGQTRVVQAMMAPLEDQDVLQETDGILESRSPTETRRGDARPGEQERRAVDRREQVRRMSLDELVDKIFTDELTGIANDRAFNDDIEAGSHAWLAEIDGDSLKWINDNLTEDSGDALLIAVAEALDQTDVDAYRVGGDEFWLGGDSKEAVQAAAELAKSILSGQTIRHPRGTTGIGITYGVGQTKEVASASMKEHKARRQTEDKRAARGTAPKHATLSVQHMKPLDMGPGTNYVPMIGHTGALPIDANNNLVLGNGRKVKIPKKPVRREHILAVLQRAFGVRIYQGRVRGKLRLGFFRPGQGEIRIKNANDIEVAAHEVAHWLDDRHPWIAALYSAHVGEVLSVSYDTSKIFEGYAEFMRLFFTQESEAIRRAPSFYDAFQLALDRQPKLRDTIHDVQELMHAWTQQGARARQASKHGAAKASVSDRIRELFRVPFFQSALDGLRRVKQIATEVRGMDEVYMKLRIAIGGASGVLEAATLYGTPGWREDGRGLEFTGDSAKEVFGDTWGTEEMALYMFARRGQELMGQNRENAQRPDEIVAGLSYATKENRFAEIFAEYQDFNKRMLDFYEGAGLIGKDTRAAIEEMNQNYVPFHRVVESEINGRNVKSGGNPFQRLKGGTQNVNNLWENIINNTGMMIRMALVNDGKRSLFKALGATHSLGSGVLDSNAGKYAAPISTREAPVRVQGNQVIRKAVEAMGITWEQYRMAKEGMVAPGSDGRFERSVVESVDRMAAGMEEFVTFFQAGLDPTGSVDYYLEDGKKVWFEIGDAALWDSLQFLGPKGSNLVLQIMGGFSAALRRGVTSTPVFGIRNFQRDSTNAWLMSDHVKVPALRAMRIVFSKMQSDPMYQEMLLNGGGFANRNQGLQAQRKIIVNPLTMIATYDRFMARFENANRLAEYKAAREADVSPRRAAFLSRNISTDFAMRGSSEVARFLAIAVPFLNARTQGNYRVTAQFDRKETAISYAVRGTAMMAATLALYAINKDDDRYKELPEDIKDLNWVIYTGEGEDDYFLEPKPFESGMLWATIPERMFELTETGDGKEFADAMLWMILQTFSMDMTPQVFQPYLELQANKKWTGAPIIPFYLENVEPSEQWTYYTSVTARKAGEMFGISPIKLEHRIRGYFGTMGTYALGVSDAMISAATDPDERAFGEDPTRGESWKSNILVRGLIGPQVTEGPPRRTKYITDLYDMIREAERVANTTDLMIRRQNARVAEYLASPENELDVLANPVLQQARKSLNEIGNQMDLVRLSRDLSGDEKRAKLWEHSRKKNALAREVILAVQEAEQRIEDEQLGRRHSAQ